MKKIIVYFTFAMLVGSCGSTKKASKYPQVTTNKPTLAFSKKTDVEGVQGVLKLHPRKIRLKARDGKLYYLFFDFVNKTLFVSSDQRIYKIFSDYLSPNMTQERQIIVQGMGFDVLQAFSQDQLQSIGVTDINTYKVAAIMNYGFVELFQQRIN